jgi:hypothetical protein
MPPEGDLGLVSTSGPVLSNGTGESVEVAAGPQARGGGVGKCAGGQRWADRFRRIGISRTTPKQPCGYVVGRLLDTFDKDLSGVSAAQH